MIINLLKIVTFILIICSSNIFSQNKKLITNKYDDGQISEKYYLVDDSLIDGDYKMWGDNGKLFLIGHYEKGKANGKWAQYYSDGHKRIEGSFSNGELDGIWITYRANGAKLSVTGFKKGVLDGEWALWYAALDEYEIIFTCGEPGVGTGTEEQWILKKPINKKTRLTKRKIINLKPDTEKNLRLIAVNYGQNLKSYIEGVLDELANEDEVLIALANVPEASELLSQTEKTAFINSLKK